MANDITLFKTPDAIHLKTVIKKDDLKKDDKVDGYFINTDEKMARRIIESLSAKKSHPASGKKRIKSIIALQGGDDSFNRRAIETLKIDYLVMPEAHSKRDTLKQRDSGINHVVAKEAAKKKISLLINLSYLKSLDAKPQAKVLARVIQNIKICRKAKCGIKVASFAKNEKALVSVSDIKRFLSSLGMSSQQVQMAIDF